MNSYNGYSGRERDRKYQEYKRLRALGLTIPELPPCHLCGDPDSKVEPHSEDYSEPYLWVPPAEYMICKPCHGRIHKRFNQPVEWADYKAHVRRGGYGKEFAASPIRKERSDAAKARREGSAYVWCTIAGRDPRAGHDWWEHLTLMADALNAPAARPRP